MTHEGGVLCDCKMRIAAYPKAWSVERGEIRKCLLHKFPYKLLYSINRLKGHRKDLALRSKQAF